MSMGLDTIGGVFFLFVPFPYMCRHSYDAQVTAPLRLRCHYNTSNPHTHTHASGCCIRDTHTAGDCDVSKRHMLNTDGTIRGGPMSNPKMIHSRLGAVYYRLVLSFLWIYHTIYSGGSGSVEIRRVDGTCLLVFCFLYFISFFKTPPSVHILLV